MTAQRFWKANAHQQAFGPGAVSFYDPTVQTYSGWTVGADFTAARLYDAMRGYNLTASGAVAWGATPAGGALDFAAAATNCQVDTVTYAPPAQYTVMALVQIGTLQKECILTWVNSTGPGQYDHMLELTAAGVINWYTYPYGRIGSTTTATTGALFHLAVTYDGTTQRLYINGRQEAQNTTATGGEAISSPVIRLGYKSDHGGYVSGTHKTLMFAVAPFAIGAGQVLEFAQSPFALFEPRENTVRSPGVAYNLSAEGITRRYSFGDASITYTPAADTGGDTHDGIKRQSRRQRALAAADARRRDEQAAEARALRLELEAAMGFAVEAAEEAPAPVVAAVERAAEAARVVLPVLRQAVDPALLAEARALVATLQSQAAEAERLRALAEDDEEVLMLLRAFR